MKVLGQAYQIEVIAFLVSPLLALNLMPVKLLASWITSFLQLFRIFFSTSVLLGILQVEPEQKRSVIVAAKVLLNLDKSEVNCPH